MITSNSKSTEYRKSEVAELLLKSFMFLNIPTEKIDSLIATNEFLISSFSSGETICNNESFEKRIFFVIDGECEVSRVKGDGTTIPLNSLERGDSFGVLAVFGNPSEYPTEIRAKKNATLVSISEEVARNLVRTHSEIAMNVITFLGNRVAFLNDKIATFSADNVEQKFAKFIISEAKKYNRSTFEINLKRTAEAINSGRASLYRALDNLTKKTFIKVENKKIYILDLQGLERYTK